MDGSLLDRTGNRITVGMIGEFLGAGASVGGRRLRWNDRVGKYEWKTEPSPPLSYHRRFVVTATNGEGVTVTTNGSDSYTIHRSMVRGVGHTNVHAAIDIINGFRREWVRSNLY